jgi:hypothetical protein
VPAPTGLVHGDRLNAAAAQKAERRCCIGGRRGAGVEQAFLLDAAFNEADCKPVKTVRLESEQLQSKWTTVAELCALLAGVDFELRAVGVRRRDLDAQLGWLTATGHEPHQERRARRQPELNEGAVGIVIVEALTARKVRSPILFY